MIKHVGRVSLILLMRGESSFRVSDFPNERAVLTKMAPRFFSEKDAFLSYPHFGYQEILAARYIAMFWQEASPIIKRGPAVPLVLSAVYDIASQLVSARQLAEIDRVFIEFQERG